MMKNFMNACQSSVGGAVQHLDTKFNAGSERKSQCPLMFEIGWYLWWKTMYVKGEPSSRRLPPADELQREPPVDREVLMEFMVTRFCSAEWCKTADVLAFLGKSDGDDEFGRDHRPPRRKRSQRYRWFDRKLAKADTGVSWNWTGFIYDFFVLAIILCVFWSQPGFPSPNVWRNWDALLCSTVQWSSTQTTKNTWDLWGSFMLVAPWSRRK